MVLDHEKENKPTLYSSKINLRSKVADYSRPSTRLISRLSASSLDEEFRYCGCFKKAVLCIFIVSLRGYSSIQE